MSSIFEFKFPFGIDLDYLLKLFRKRGSKITYYNHEQKIIEIELPSAGGIEKFSIRFVGKEEGFAEVHAQPIEREKQMKTSKASAIAS